MFHAKGRGKKKWKRTFVHGLGCNTMYTKLVVLESVPPQNESILISKVICNLNLWGGGGPDKVRR